jgi:multiple sugar transport system permease protein/raffinose/stachyose/melibiose transport system permease protein
MALVRTMPRSASRAVAAVARKSTRILTLVPLALITTILLGPLFWTLMMSFRRTTEINQNPYALPIPFHVYNYGYAFLPPREELVSIWQALGRPVESLDAWLRAAGMENGGFGFGTYFLNSVLTVGPALAIVTLITTMAAYVFARDRYYFPGRGLVFVFIFLSMFFPPQITLLSLFQLSVSYDIYNTRWALMLIYPATAIAFNTYLLRAFFAQIPTEIEDAARIDGCNDLRMYWSVMLPIAKPAVATTLILNINGFWNEFLYALTMVTKPELHTIPLASWRWVGEYYLDVGGLAAGLVVSMLPIIILYSVLSEQFTKGMTAGAVKG